MSRVAKRAAKVFAKTAKLRALGPAGTKELKRLRDVYYDTDPFHPSAGMAWNPEGKRKVRGSSAKCDRINSAFNAKKRQGV